MTPSTTPRKPRSGAAKARSTTDLMTVEAAIEAFRRGEPLIIVDDENRENEGDIAVPAQFCTTELVNLMASEARGLICVPMDAEHCDRLDLPPMATRNTAPLGTAFTVAVEAREGVTTGISAHDRAHTISVAIDPRTGPADIATPGHVFPLRARAGGVLVRAGHTEAGCDLAGMAGLEPASVICEILKEDGTMARLPDLLEYSKEHGLKIGTIADLIHYRAANESLVDRSGEREIETPYGPFRLVVYRDKIGHATHLALTLGEIAPDSETLVRVHEPVSLIDVLDADAAGHAYSVPSALRIVAEQGKGAIVLLHRPESADELAVRALPAGETASARKFDLRNYGTGAQILRDLGVGKMRLLATPRKMPAMDGFGLEVVGYYERN
jgi:3,4-dihydroxy 2-butanone 4-phosphate synthase/GTP cyclohydrolase II